MNIPVVIVDDDETDRYITKRILTESSVPAEVVEFVAGDDFINVIKDKNKRMLEIGKTPPPMLVLLDINMPRMSGFEVLEQLKGNLTQDENEHCMVVLMFSSSNHAKDREDALSHDFVRDYIVKPLTAEKAQEIFDKYY